MKHTIEALKKRNTLSVWFLILAVPFYMWWSSLDHAAMRAAWETANNPVMIEGTWGKGIAPTPDGIIVRNSAAMKVRECGWIRTEFFLGTRLGTFSNIGEGSGLPNPARHLDPPIGRKIGPQLWQEIFLPITPTQFNDGQAFADAIHRCDDDHVVRSRLFN